MSLGTKLTVQWVPDPNVIAQQIVEVAAALADRSAPLALAAQTAADAVRERFEGQHGPGGEAWQGWSEKYAPVAERTNTGILQRTGELESAATSLAAYIVTQDSVFFDTSGLPPYGGWMQHGAPNAAIPARPFLGSDDALNAQIFADFVLWFDAAISLYSTSTGRIGRRHSFRGPGGRFASLG